MGKISKKLLEGLLVGALTFGGLKGVFAPYSERDLSREYEKVWQERIIQEQNAERIRVPFIRTPADYCARYAVLSAKKLFNKDYERANTWDLKYSNPVVYEFGNEKNVEEAIFEGILTPGMLIISKRPVEDIKEYGRQGLDIKNNPIEATHVVEYIGFGNKAANEVLDSPEPLFLHQFGLRKEIKTQKQLWDDYQLEFIRILNDKKLD